MKKLKKINAAWITGILIVLSGNPVLSQTPNKINTSFIEPYYLAITSSMTTNLIFPYNIKSVDRGSTDILAQKANGVENILQIKAGKEDFKKTNLTVITGDGKLYSFLLSYTSSPSVLNLVLEKQSDKACDALFSPGRYNEAELKSFAKKAMRRKEKLHGVKEQEYNMTFQLDGLFIRQEAMYFRIKVANYSDVNYDIDQLRLFIRDQQKVKRTASQEIEMKPLYILNDTSIIAGQTTHCFVFALPKFTIPDKKYLIIQLMEKNGGRHLTLKVRNKKIIKAVRMN